MPTGNDTLLCSCEWVASCTGCGEEGPYFVKNRLNPRGRRHTSHFLEDNQIKACGQFKRKPRLLPFLPPSSFFLNQFEEGGDVDVGSKRKGGVGARHVDSLSAGMFVVFTTNDDEEKVARVAEFDVGGADCSVEPVYVYGNLLIRYKNEPRESLSFDQINSVLAPRALQQTDYPANVVTILTARNNISMYYTSCAVRMNDSLTNQLKKAHAYKRLRTADSVIQAYLNTDHPDNVLDPAQRKVTVPSSKTPKLIESSGDSGSGSGTVVKSRRSSGSSAKPSLPLPPLPPSAPSSASEKTSNNTEGIAASHQTAVETSEPEAAVWLADCTGCGKEGEFKVTRCATGGNRYKRHNVTVNKCTTYCGVFRLNARPQQPHDNKTTTNDRNIAQKAVPTPATVTVTSATPPTNAIPGASRNGTRSSSRPSTTVPGSKKSRACGYIKQLGNDILWNFPMANVPLLSEEAQPLLKCSVCDKSCKNKQVLVTHMRRVHGPAKASPVGSVGGVLGSLGGGPASFSSTDSGESASLLRDEVHAAATLNHVGEGHDNPDIDLIRDGQDNDSGGEDIIADRSDKEQDPLTTENEIKEDITVGVEEGKETVAEQNSIGDVSAMSLVDGSSSSGTVDSPPEVLSKDSNSENKPNGSINGTHSKDSAGKEELGITDSSSESKESPNRNKAEARDKIRAVGNSEEWLAGCSTCGVQGTYLQRHVVVSGDEETSCGCFNANPCKGFTASRVGPCGAKRMLEGDLGDENDRPLKVRGVDLDKGGVAEGNKGNGSAIIKREDSLVDRVVSVGNKAVEHS